MRCRSSIACSALLGMVLSLAGCSAGDAADDAGPAPQAVAQALPAQAGCRKGGLVDAEFRDAALDLLARLAVDAPGRDAHGAIRLHHTPGHIDPDGRAWHFVPAYHVNLALSEALRVAPSLAPTAAAWLRWQARHIHATGPSRGVVFDHWVRESDLLVHACPPGGPAARCPDVDSHDSTAASLLLMAESYRAATADVALLREPAVRAALQASAAEMAALAQPDGLTWAKPGYPVAYLMDAVEVVAGWRAWARVQYAAYGDTPGALAASAAALRTETSMRRQLWHAPSQAWRFAVQAGAPDFSRWYPDSVAQAWPLLWDVAGDRPDDAANAWGLASARWLGQQDWSRRNVDPDGAWWPAVAAAAYCVGDAAAARTWVARARAAWLRPVQAFAWPFHVGDLRWLFWLADPL